MSQLDQNNPCFIEMLKLYILSCITMFDGINLLYFSWDLGLERLTRVMPSCQKDLDENCKKAVEPRSTHIRSNAENRTPPAAVRRRTEQEKCKVLLAVLFFFSSVAGPTVFIFYSICCLFFVSICTFSVLYLYLLQ